MTIILGVGLSVLWENLWLVKTIQSWYVSKGHIESIYNQIKSWQGSGANDNQVQTNSKFFQIRAFLTTTLLAGDTMDGLKIVANNKSVHTGAWDVQNGRLGYC